MHFYFAECKSLPSAVVALRKSFAECPTCGTRQRSLCHEGICRQLFAEWSTRQRFCRVQSLLCRVQLHSAKKALHSVKPLPSAALGKELSAYPVTAKASLPSAACRALDKGFPECHDGTRQRKAAVTARSRCRPLCRVPRVGTRQRNMFFIF